ncbi:hypothetical protein [Prochlorococcus sp. MIT 1307]|uniref:hypothetical protein n=1 Tax=Prochlorococcus sp. MIT 1307 TaxID=3096219 RepID=UPI002A758A6B|nr:hypothetical protein [Prochlorococcus sp. MIT 1307]
MSTLRKDIKLGFSDIKKIVWIRLPACESLLFEAPNRCHFALSFTENFQTYNDLMIHLFIDKYNIRHLVTSYDRIQSVLRYSIRRFALKQCDHYLLPLATRHERIAELVGAVRLNFTRQITKLGDANLLLIDTFTRNFIITNSFLSRPI